MGHIGQPRPRRWLGARDSWRRIILTGIAGGIALAIVAVLASSVCGGGSGSLDEDEPTALPTAADPGPGADEPADEPTDVPIETEAPVTDTPAPTATDAPAIEPTATTVATPLPTMPPATETALPPPTPEATAKP